VTTEYHSEDHDLLIALHACRSRSSVERFNRRHPDRSIVVALTGTDLYRDLAKGGRSTSALEIADRLLALQPLASAALAESFRSKVRVIYQSVTPFGPVEVADARAAGRVKARPFRVCVVGHLRQVKDPFRTAMAARQLPASSRVKVIHIGHAMNESMATRARQEMKLNARYRWIGEQPGWRVRRELARASL
jgi:hypothetical protein